MKQWKIAILGTLLEIQNGYAFDSKLFDPTAGLPLIRIRDLKIGMGTETRFNGPYDKKYIVNAGDLLIGMDGDFGCYEWKGEPSLLNQRVCRLQKFDQALHPKFLLYGINGFLKEIEKNTGFITVKHLSSKTIQGIEFPLPPLAVQKVIVAKLDAAFASIDTAIAAAEKNAENAKQLFQRYLSDVFERGGDGLNFVELGNVCSFQNGFAFKSTLFTDTGVPILRISNIQKNAVDTKRIVYTHPDKYKENLTKYVVEKGDLLIAMSGATTGKVGFNTTDTKFLLNQRVGKFIPKPALSIQYLFHFLSTQVEKNLSISAGAAQPNLSTEQIKSMKIPLPSIQKQNAITSDISVLSTENEKLERIYKDKASLLPKLKQSLLQQAFSGQLVDA